MASPTSDRRQGLAGNTAYKAPATVVATSNVTLSGEQTVDGVAVKAINTAGYADRVLCTAQRDATQNGLWDVNTGAWTRSVDANGNYDWAQGTQVMVTGGSHAFQAWNLTTAGPITVGTTALSFSPSVTTATLATLAGSAGAALVGWIQAGIGAIVRTVLAKLREEVSADDFGADPTGAADSYAGITAAFVASPFVKLTKGGNYKTSQQVAVPVAGTLSGSGRGSATLTVTANVPALLLNAYSKVRRLQVRQSFGGHSVNLIEVGSNSISARCATLEEIDVASAGQDNIAIINGNLGAIGNVSSTSATRDNLSFYGGLPNVNAWRSFGYIDLNAAGRDNLHIGGGTSLSDANASRTHTLTFAAQGAGRYNAYVGSRSNLLCAYVEAAATADVYFDTYGQGNELRCPESSTITDNAATANSNLIYNGNLGAGYVRGFASKLMLSGVSGKGLGFYNDDGTAGAWQVEKRGTRNLTIACSGSAATAQVSILNDVGGQATQLGVGGNAFPLTDNTYTTGTASFRWSIVYAATGAINTSDQREKQDIRALNTAEKAVATSLKALVKAYRWQAAYAAKGEGARIHFGWMAQDVIAAFQAQGLDAFAYGCCCHDTWDEVQEVKDANGIVITPRQAAGDRYGVRMDEILAFILGAA